MFTFGSHELSDHSCFLVILFVVYLLEINAVENKHTNEHDAADDHHSQEKE
jgi:hypothetical protein